MRHIRGLRQGTNAAMDWQGQNLCDRVAMVIIYAFATVGFVIGFITQQLSHSIYSILAGTAIACLACLPDWPIYNRNPLPFQPVPDNGKQQTRTKQGRK
ncbi:Signal peptidase complex subunit 1 [Plasmodiophora brassicae]